MLRGSCLCGAVHWESGAPARASHACHCSQCRKTSGHYWSATAVPTASLTITGSQALRWYASSAQGRRGFCATCGSSLFWQIEGQDMTSIASGSIDGPSGLITERHIHCGSKGDYYEIEPGPQQIP
ncbi:GFA family protein [Pseudooceanicola sp. HF7]|uniref:GFA family protein n=1 Tax=Pseudooceanicola sp. HF7 TaxID=2721560 RepID=UPI0014305357|nr:GFA family protein [Pseudooceanicola sp. HF7]NIZ09024.1 GFA family protein [Pseudooceanicola sp. HF7]